MARLVPISGLAAKAPACFLVETGKARLLLDFGEGPDAGVVPDISKIGKVDAILISHQHGDHIGSLSRASKIGSPPVYATKIVRPSLPANLKIRPLPLHGETKVCGVTIRTGRSGHAPGGVWMHLALGGGLLYLGDNCAESILYTADAPPKADTIVIDASYGDYDKGIATSMNAIEDAAARGPLLLPAVTQGRGPEIALHLYRRGILPAIDEDIRRAIKDLAGKNADCVHASTIDDLRRLAREAPKLPSKPAGVMIAANAPASKGASKRLIAKWRDDKTVDIVFTGYVAKGSPALELVKRKRARVIRWNIHPRLSDNVALVKSAGAKTVLAGFGDRSHEAAWRTAFGDRRLIVDGGAEL